MNKLESMYKSMGFKNIPGSVDKLGMDLESFMKWCDSKYGGKFLETYALVWNDPILAKRKLILDKYIKLIEDNKTALENDKLGKGFYHKNSYDQYKSRIGFDISIKSNTEKIKILKKRLKLLKK